ncbi:MAG: hypothetical protein QM607_01505 [Microbacterium sp.]
MSGDGGPAGPNATREATRRPTGWIVAAVLAALLLVVGGILLGTLISGGRTAPAATPETTDTAAWSAGATAVATPSASSAPAAEAPAPPSATTDPRAAVIDSFTVGDLAALCLARPTPDADVPLEFTWSTRQAEDVSIFESDDGVWSKVDSGYPASGSSPILNDCGRPHDYRLTAVGADGVEHSAEVHTDAVDTSAAAIGSFAAAQDAAALCAALPEGENEVDLSFSWTASNVVQLAFGIDTPDAISAPYQSGLPASGSLTVNHLCDDPQQYTLTAVGTDGVHRSQQLSFG